MANTKFSGQNSLTGFATNKTLPQEYTVRQANRIPIVRNADPTDTRRNFKQHKYQADWLLIQESEIIICFPNRQELVNFASIMNHTTLEQKQVYSSPLQQQSTNHGQSQRTKLSLTKVYFPNQKVMVTIQTSSHTKHPHRTTQ